MSFLPHGYEADDTSSLSRANNEFGFWMFNKLSVNNKNDVISPISLIIAFSKTLYKHYINNSFKIVFFKTFPHLALGLGSPLFVNK